MTEHKADRPHGSGRPRRTTGPGRSGGTTADARYATFTVFVPFCTHGIA